LPANQAVVHFQVFQPEQQVEAQLFHWLQVLEGRSTNRVEHLHLPWKQESQALAEAVQQEARQSWAAGGRLTNQAEVPRLAFLVSLQKVRHLRVLANQLANRKAILLPVEMVGFQVFQPQTQPVVQSLLPYRWQRYPLKLITNRAEVLQMGKTPGALAVLRALPASPPVTQFLDRLEFHLNWQANLAKMPRPVAKESPRLVFPTLPG
jgi:hypothetical protein